MKTIIKGIMLVLVLSLFLYASPGTVKAQVSTEIDPEDVIIFTFTQEELEVFVQSIVQRVIARIKAIHAGDDPSEGCEEELDLQEPPSYQKPLWYKDRSLSLP